MSTLGTNIADASKLANAQIGFHVTFYEALERMDESELMQLANVIPSTTSLEEYESIGDLPGFEEWTDDRPMSEMKAGRFQITNKDWASGLNVRRNDIMDNKLGLVTSKIQMLAAKAKRHRWDLMIKVLLNGFAGNAYPTVGDGLAYDGALFFATTHAFGSNKLTTALSEAALDEAEKTFGLMTTADGKDPLDCQGTHLIVGPKLFPTAKRLVGNGMLINAGGTAAGSNIYQGRYTVIESRRLVGTYDDYWFLADLSQPVKPLIFQIREEINTAQQVDWSSEAMFNKAVLKYGAQARYNVGYYAPQTIIGSVVA